MSITIALFIGCWLATCLLTPAVMRLARRMDAVDRGGYRKISLREVPLLGGLAVAFPLSMLCLGVGVAGFLVNVYWQYLFVHHREWFDSLYTLAGARYDCVTLALGGIAILILGIVDDTKALRARWKLVGQIAVATFVCLSGHVLTSVAIPLFGVVEFGREVGVILTMLWVVGVINAFNLIDGIDGLATGIALVGAVALVALSIIQDAAFVTYAGAALAGSLLAFLLFNFPPARVFLGDTGSMFIGYCLAILSLIGAHKAEAAAIVLAPILALSLPLFETVVSMVRRYLRGVPIFSGDSHHTHHRLLKKGYSQPQVVLTLCGTALLLAAAAILSALIPENSRYAWFPYALYIGTLVNIAWLAGYLRPTNVRAALERRQRNRAYQALSRYARLRLSAGLQAPAVNTLLEMCRQELGLKHLQLQLAGGQPLLATPLHGEALTGQTREELHLRSADARDIYVHYQFEDAPDVNRRHDVSFCLADIFDGLPLNEPGDVPLPLPMEEAGAAEPSIVDFRKRPVRKGE